MDLPLAVTLPASSDVLGFFLEHEDEIQQPGLLRAARLGAYWSFSVVTPSAARERLIEHLPVGLVRKSAEFAVVLI